MELFQATWGRYCRPGSSKDPMLLSPLGGAGESCGYALLAEAFTEFAGGGLAFGQAAGEAH